MGRIKQGRGEGKGEGYLGEEQVTEQERLLAALEYQETQRPALMNPNLMRQGMRRRGELPALPSGGPLQDFVTQSMSLDPQPDQGYGTMAAEMALGFVPGVGQAMAARDIERGRRANDPVMMGLGAASLIPMGKLISALRGRKPMGPVLELDVYHGSPHKLPPTPNNPLGEFDASKIGTGEGAQAYSYGHYFAENPGVGGGYARGLSKNTIEDRAINFNDPREVAALEVHLNQGNMARSADSLYRAAQQRTHSAPPSVAKKASELLDAILEKKLPNELPKIQQGYLYKVDLPDDQIAKMLDWDKPLSQQPESVRKALLPEVKAMLIRNGTPPKQAEFFALRKYGKDIRGEMRGGIGDKAFAEKMRALGIPGVRYLDQGSRAAPSSAQFVKSEVVGAADDLTALAKSMGLDATVQHSGSNAGKSSYVSVFDPMTNRYIRSSFRISDHGTGPLRHQDHIHINSPAGLVTQKNDLFKWVKRNRTEKGVDTTDLKAPSQGTSNFVVFPGGEKMLNILERK